MDTIPKNHKNLLDLENMDGNIAILGQVFNFQFLVIPKVNDSKMGGNLWWAIL